MLSRTADHLFWMARYMERAENTARMLDVNYQMSLLPQTEGAAEQGWRGLLSISELSGDFAKRYGDVTPKSVMDYMVSDAANGSSIRSCLMQARENARAVRGTLTTEVWETQNQTWLEFQRMVADDAFGKSPGVAFEWVKFRSHLSRGVTVGTMLQDEAFHFLRIGSFLERSDNTARLLDVKFHAAAPELFGRRRAVHRRAGRRSRGRCRRPRSRSPRGHPSPSPVPFPVARQPTARIEPDDAEADGKDVEYEFYHWSAVLRSVSGFEVYRKVYRNVIRPEKVAELLILRPRHAALAGGLHARGRVQLAARRQRAVARHAAPGRPPRRRSAIRPHRRDPRDRPACVPDAVPRARQRAGRRHQPGLSRAGGALDRRHRQRPCASPRRALDDARGAQARQSKNIKKERMSIHVALNHVTHYRYDRADPSRPAGRAAAAGAAFAHAHPQLLDARGADRRTSSTGSRIRSRITWRGWSFPKVTTFFRVEVDLVAEMAVMNPFDFFLEPSAEKYPFAYEPELRVELAPYLTKAPATPAFAAYLASIDLTERPTSGFLMTSTRRCRRTSPT